MHLCTCFVKALGFNSAFGVSRLSLSQRRLIYSKRSLACHPDKHPSDKKDEATRAQTLLNLAKEELIDDEAAATRYLQSGVPAEAHNCVELEKTAKLINELSGDLPTSTTSEQLTPPRTPEKTSKLTPGNLLRWLASTRRSRGNSSPPNTPRVDHRCRSEAAQVIHLTDCEWGAGSTTGSAHCGRGD